MKRKEKTLENTSQSKTLNSFQIHLSHGDENMTITSIKDKLFGTAEESINPIEMALATIEPPVETMKYTVEASSQVAPAPKTAPVAISISKVFKVGDKEYSSREEAIVAAAMDTLHSEIPLGIDNVIAKSVDIIKALQVVGKKK
jgi:hypothetical protein